MQRFIGLIGFLFLLQGGLLGCEHSEVPAEHIPILEPSQTSAVVPEPAQSTTDQSNATAPTPADNSSFVDWVDQTPAVIDGEVTSTPPQTKPKQEPKAENTVLRSGTTAAQVVFSSDGSKVAYAFKTSGLAHDLYVMDIASGEIRMVSNNVVLMMLTDGVKLSPNGEHVVFRKTLDGGAGSWHDMGELWSWDWKSNALHSISETVLRGAWRFTPNGTSVVYVETQSRRLHVYDLQAHTTILVEENVWAMPHAPVEQTLPISSDSQYLGYSVGSYSKAKFYVHHLATGTSTLISETALPRTTRFVGNNAFFHETGQSWPERLATYDTTSKTITRSGVAYNVTWDENYTRAAYLSHKNHGELLVWDPSTGKETVVYGGVGKNRFKFDSSGQFLVYLRTPFNNQAHGQLHLANLVESTDTLVDSWVSMTRSSAWFSPGSQYLVYNGNGCDWSTEAVVYDIAQHHSTALDEAVGCNVHMLPHANGFSFQRTSVSPALAEYRFDTEQVAVLSTHKSYLITSPNGWTGVYRLTKNGSSKKSMLVRNWDTGTSLVIDGPASAGLLSMSDTHMVYWRQGENSGVFLAPLPQ